jgi:tripartite-type tricarboxylate transporter receptor subunit TctC
LPDVPAVGEFVKDDYTRRILQLILAPQDMDRPVLAPPGTPMDRVAALRTAFHKAMHDPAFIAEMKQRNLAIQELSGPQVAEILERAFALPPEIVRDAKDAMSAANAN